MTHESILAQQLDDLKWMAKQFHFRHPAAYLRYDMTPISYRDVLVIEINERLHSISYKDINDEMEHRYASYPFAFAKEMGRKFYLLLKIEEAANMISPYAQHIQSNHSFSTESKICTGCEETIRRG
jgi:hypothetical protein